MAQNIKNVKFNVTFWQMFLLIITAAVVGGVIYKYSFDSVVIEDANSISFPVHKVDDVKTPTKK